MRKALKITCALLSLAIFVTPFADIGLLLFKVRAQSISYGSWSGWSGWQDAYVSEVYEGAEKIREVQTDPNVIASTNYKTVYNYYRYANQYTGGYGSYAQSSSYPNYYSYTFDSELPYTDSTGGGRYKYWYSSSNYISVYASSPYTTQEVVSYNYKTQYRYRTRTATYSYTVAYDATLYFE